LTCRRSARSAFSSPGSGVARLNSRKANSKMHSSYIYTFHSPLLGSNHQKTSPHGHVDRYEWSMFAWLPNHAASHFIILIPDLGNEQSLHLRNPNIMPLEYCDDKNCWTETIQVYCDLHRCAIPGCRSAREAGQYCVSHVPCTKDGCHNFQCIYDERYRTRPLCVTHWYTCRDPSCFVRELSIMLKYCSEHKCRLNGCEERIENDGRLHCARHGCHSIISYWRHAVVFCDASGADANAGRRYCTGCTCIVPSCDAKHYTSTSGDSRACKTHRCRAPDCDDVREDDAVYCIDHKLCAKLDCDTARPVGAKYCRRHRNTCVEVDCFQERAVLGEWKGTSKKPRWCPSGKTAEACRQHKCSETSCGTTGYCGQHNRYR
jgi:hypothetical protein